MKQHRETADITFRTTKETADWLDEQAARLGISRSALLNMRLNQQRRHEQQAQQPQQAA